MLFLIVVKTLFQNVNINLRAVEEISAYYSTCGQVNGINKIVWALKALQLTDLTTLAGDDTLSNVRRLCIRANFPFTDHDLQFVAKDVQSKIHTAAVCVYPSRVKDAFETLQSLEGGQRIQIAAGIFPKFKHIFFMPVFLYSKFFIFVCFVSIE